MASGFVWVEDTLTPGLDSFPERLENAVGAVMEYFEGQVQDYARDNAPWTDQTGNARGGLFAQYVRPGGAGGRDAKGRFTKKTRKHVIVLYHTMDYGVFLETRWDGRFAIIEPTVQHQGAQLMRAVGSILERMS